MTRLQKKFLLVLSLFSVSVLGSFFLFFPETTKAEAIFHFTECGEKKEIGTFGTRCCKYACVAWDPLLGDCIVWDCVVSCIQYNCGWRWVEYRAETVGCATKIFRRTCVSYCGPAVSCCPCGRCQVRCYEKVKIEQCHAWEKAERDCLVTRWGRVRPVCKCAGECLEPKNPRYYDNEK